MYHKLCTLVMNLSRVPSATHPRVDGQGVYYSIYFGARLFYEGAELKVQAVWMENVSALNHSWVALLLTSSMM